MVVIKADSGQDAPVRGIEAALTPPPMTREAARIGRLEVQLAEQRRIHAELVADNARLKEEAETAAAKALEQGIAEGRRQVEARRSEADARIARGVDQALARFEAQQAVLETLALEAAMVGLERIVGDPAERRDLVAAAVRRTIQEVFGEAVLAVEVSARDFPDREAAGAIAEALTGRPVELKIQEDAAPGACVLRLKLGAVDAGLDGQMTRLKAFLAHARPWGSHAG